MITTLRGRLAGIVCIMLALMLTGFGCSRKRAVAPAKKTPAAAEEYQTSTGGDPGSFYLVAKDQESNGTTVAIDRAVFKDTKGWVAIHANAGGAPGPVLGVSELLPAGETANLKVTLTKPLTKNATVYPMLHLEDNNNSTYDFPNGDAPAKAGQKVVVIPVKMEITK